MRPVFQTTLGNIPVTFIIFLCFMFVFKVNIIVIITNADQNTILNIEKDITCIYVKTLNWNLVNLDQKMILCCVQVYDVSKGTLIGLPLPYLMEAKNTEMTFWI